jgi:hypothetical protein
MRIFIFFQFNYILKFLFKNFGIQEINYLSKGFIGNRLFLFDLLSILISDFMKLIYIITILAALSFFSCGTSDNTSAKRIMPTKMQINTLKKVFDPASVRIFCDSLTFNVINSGNKILKLVIRSGNTSLDTVLLNTKNLNIGIEKNIIKADLDFDGNCEFIIPDKNSTKEGGVKHYYFMFEPESRKFIENKTLPAYISSFKLDVKNQRVKLYCPNQECFAYYKYNTEKKFELVQGEFKSVD